MKPSTGFDPPRLFIDTWGWLVLADANHPAHPQAIRLRRRQTDLGRALVTTDYVLDEMITRLYARSPFAQAERFCGGVFQEQRLGLLAVEPITPERFQKAYQLRLRYRDKPRISFTDLTSFSIMRELGIRHALTADQHFVQAHLGFQILP